MKKRILFLSALCAVAVSANAASNGNGDDNGWNACAHMGHAWSLKSGLANPDTAVFATLASTDTDDAKLNKASFVGLGLNKQLWSWLSAGVSYDLYSGFSYRAFHKGGTTGTVEKTGAVYSRSFDVNHSSAMLNVNLNLPEDWRMEVGSMSISPALGGGVGIGVNEVANFKAIDALGVITTSAANNSKASLAYHACGGLQFQAEDSNVGFGLNYRYYYGGKFASAGKYVFATTGTAATDETSAKAWEGKVKAHQLQFALNWAF